ncbi:MAG: HEPN domain-containing protein [Patescibacteria group bacterium]|nr:HEPN domain-containing protein [Patescibacteria group bacterium]
MFPLSSDSGEIFEGDKEFLNFEEELKTLDAYYIESRYPPEVRVYSPKECQEILSIAKKLTQFVANKIV